MKYLFNLCLGLFITCISFAFASSEEETITLRKHFVEKLDRAGVQRNLTDVLVEDLLTCDLPTIPLSEVKTIVAYAFGNRIQPNGNRLPGPTNEELADLTVKLYNESGAHVYAQWEIVEAVDGRIPQEHITSINPTLDDKANVVYLSTTGVAKSIIHQAGSAEDLGKVVIIGFHDHAKRCLQTSRKLGMDAYMPEGYIMPTQYDQQSGQPWTLNRVSYLEHELRTRVQAIAASI